MSKLITRSVSGAIVKMAVPMFAGTFAMNMYNLTNAWFVSRLGTEALAAISFTFPVIMFLMFLTRGGSAGAMTLVAHALGAGDRDRASMLTTHALLLAFVVALLVSIAGILTIRPLFGKLGASGHVLVLTGKYMVIWYAGAVVMITQMFSADIIIGTGNTKIISILIVSTTLVNAFFDMGLIFGMFGMPRMGIVGAAVATIISQLTALLGAIFILYRRMGLISFKGFNFKILFQSWVRILKFGVPGAFGMILTPIAAVVIVHMVAGYGNAAVAAIGVAGRIEMFAFMIPMTVGMSMIPFVAQNYGAMRMDRIRKARKGAMIFALAYGAFISTVFFLAINPMARIFSHEQAVIDVLRSYICITCAGYGFMEVNRYAGFCMTGIHEPVKASYLSISRNLFLLIPFSLAGGYLFHLNGIFTGRLVSDIAAGIIGILWSGRVLRMKEKDMQSISVH